MELYKYGNAITFKQRMQARALEIIHSGCDDILLNGKFFSDFDVVECKNVDNRAIDKLCEKLQQFKHQDVQNCEVLEDDLETECIDGGVVVKINSQKPQTRFYCHRHDRQRVQLHAAYHLTSSFELMWSSGKEVAKKAALEHSKRLQYTRKFNLTTDAGHESWENCLYNKYKLYYKLDDNYDVIELEIASFERVEYPWRAKVKFFYWKPIYVYTCV